MAGKQNGAAQTARNINPTTNANTFVRLFLIFMRYLLHLFMIKLRPRQMWDTPHISADPSRFPKSAIGVPDGFGMTRRWC
ncbi:MAG: hypothetical protein QOH51_1516 [Acidobacteriota bacterium]|jgi:hypothetical protein|nr:hypothetical protein [Acidobacteriota bacterium]